MKSYIKSEFHRAIFSKNSLVCLLIMLISFFIAFLDFINYNFNNIHNFKDIYDCVDVFLMMRNFSVASILPIVAPLLAAIVFSDSYLEDKNSGFLKFICTRMDKKQYIKIRLIVNAIVSGSIILIASLIALIFSICIYGVSIKPVDPINLSGVFSNLYYNNKWIYFIIILVMSFIFNMIFSTLALGVSTFINNKYLSFLIPFFYYIMSGTIFVMLRLYRLNAVCLFMPRGGSSALSTILYQIVLLAVGGGLFYFGVLYRYEKDL